MHQPDSSSRLATDFHVALVAKDIESGSQNIAYGPGAVMPQVLRN